MLIKKLSISEIDNLKVRLYKEFYENNKSLYIKDALKYAQESSEYVYRRVQRIIYFGKDDV